MPSPQMSGSQARAAEIGESTDPAGAVLIDKDVVRRLGHVKQEIEKVKECLSSKKPQKHYGMEGKRLQDYLVQLTKKECSLYDLAYQVNEALRKGETLDDGTTIVPGPGGDTLSHTFPRVPQAPVIEDYSKFLDRVPTLDKEDLTSTIAYLDYLKDCPSVLAFQKPDADDLPFLHAKLLCKGLKALKSLAYKVDCARKAFEKNIIRILDVIMRRFYSYGDGSLVAVVAGVLCNLVLPDDCEKLFSDRDGVNVLVILLNAMALFPSHTNLQQKGAETFARLLEGAGNCTDDTCSNDSETTAASSACADNTKNELRDIREIPPERSRGYGFVRVLILAKGRPLGATGTGDEAFAHCELLKTLFENEACSTEIISKGLASNIKDAQSAVEDEYLLVGACTMISGLCSEMDVEMYDFSTCLRELGMIKSLLDYVPSDGEKSPVSLTNYGARCLIESVARIISTSHEGLIAFVNLKGVPAFEKIMTNFPRDPVVQARAIRALASGIDWPQEIRTIAKFNYVVLLQKTQQVMMYHKADPFVLRACFEGFYKFLPLVDIGANAKVIGEIEYQIRELMKRYEEDEKLKTWGNHIGEMIAAQ